MRTALITVLSTCVLWLAAVEETKPNILWITGEDMSARWLGCYGNDRIKTPHFDRLAQDGFLYTHCFASVPVCAPARSSWITGIHPVSNGTIYMRSLNAVPERLVWYPDALRANGYYTANYHKTDYNTSNRREPGFGGGENRGTCGHFTGTWDSYENFAWRNPGRKAGQPFFQVLNAAGCHESHLHKQGNGNTGVDPASMKLATYHPDIPEMRQDYARYTAGVMNADRALGNILGELEKDGLADDTIVIYTSDHGGVIGRSKRFLYDSGTHAAHIIRIPEKFRRLWPAAKPGVRLDRLVSFIDMPKTWLAITGSPIPSDMQGHVYLGEHQDPLRQHVFIARQRMDDTPDMQRAVRDRSFLYIRNYESFRPDGQFLEYQWKAPSMSAWEAWHRAGKTDAATGAFFRPRPVEYLFDCEIDPDNVNNLAQDPTQSERLAHLRKILREQQLALGDCGFLPEGALVHRAEQHHTTIHDLIRNPSLYPQAAYMDAADLATFCAATDLPALIRLLKAEDEGLRFWGVMGCLKLGQQAATPEVLALMERLITTDTKRNATLDVRVTAALYLCRIGHRKSEALRSLADIIATADSPAATGRAWADLFLLGSDAAEIIPMLAGMRLKKPDEDLLQLVRTRSQP